MRLVTIFGIQADYCHQMKRKYPARYRHHVLGADILVKMAKRNGHYTAFELGSELGLLHYSLFDWVGETLKYLRERGYVDRKESAGVGHYVLTPEGHWAVAMLQRWCRL